jgi:hypothetical protein
MMLASALVAWRVVMCYVLSSMLGCKACIVEVILASRARMLGMSSWAMSLPGC